MWPSLDGQKVVKDLSKVRYHKANHAPYNIGCLVTGCNNGKKKISKIIPINGALQTKYMRKTNWLEPQNSGHCGFYNSELTTHLIEKSLA